MAPGQVFTKTKEIINDTAKLRNGLLVISLSCTCSLTSSVRVSLSSIGFTLSIIRAPWRSMIRSISWGTSRSRKEIELIKFLIKWRTRKLARHEGKIYVILNESLKGILRHWTLRMSHHVGRAPLMRPDEPYELFCCSSKLLLLQLQEKKIGKRQIELFPVPWQPH